MQPPEQRPPARMEGDPDRIEAVEPCGDRIGGGGSAEQGFFHCRWPVINRIEELVYVR